MAQVVNHSQALGLCAELFPNDSLAIFSHPGQWMASVKGVLRTVSNAIYIAEHHTQNLKVNVLHYLPMSSVAHSVEHSEDGR